MKKHYENKKIKSINEENKYTESKYSKKIKECSKTIELMTEMLPENFLIRKKNGKIALNDKKIKEIVEEIKEKKYENYSNKVGYYKSNRISHQDVEQVLAIYLCGKWNNFNDIKNLSIDEYKSKKEFFNEETYKNAIEIIHSLKKQYGKYGKPNPTMHILNMLLRLKNIKSKNPNFKLDDKFVNFVIEDSGSIDARSDIDTFFIGGNPRNETKILHNSDFNKKLFICFGLEKEFNIIANNIKNRNFGLYIPTGSHINVNSMVEKSKTPNNTANAVNIKNVIEKMEKAVYNNKIDSKKLSHNIEQNEEHKIENLSEQNKYLNDNDFSMKMLIKKVISDDNIKDDSEIKKSVNFILNSGKELNNINSYKNNINEIKNLASKIFKKERVCDNFIKDYNKFDDKTKEKHIKNLAKIYDKELSNSFSVEESLNKIVKYIKEIKTLKNNNKLNVKNFIEIKDKIKYEIIKFKKVKNQNNINRL